MKNSTSKSKRWKSILLALFFTFLTAGVVLGMTVWMVGGTIGAFLSDEDDGIGAAESAKIEKAGEQDRSAEAISQADVPVRLDGEHWRTKERRLAEMLAQGQTETFRFSEAELNAMLEDARRHGDLEGRATIKLTDSLLQADIKMPIRNLPILGERFLDARIVLKIALGDGDEKFYIKSLVPRSGDWRTRALLKGLENRDLSRVLEQTPVAEELRRNFQRIAVEDDALVLVTRARPSVENERQKSD